jgi:excinuclease ABC subunit A
MSGRKSTRKAAAPAASGKPAGAGADACATAAPVAGAGADACATALRNPQSALRNRPVRLRGVRHNNLKGFDLDLPAGKLIVVTGLSGAGKSSLVFDTLHAEGQRRYAETFSAYTRQFLELLDRPRVDAIEDIRPSIAVEQGNTVRTSRSTVGTMTELCDYFKVWFAHAATLFDPATGRPIHDDSPATIWRQARAAFPDAAVQVCFSLPRPPALPWDDVRASLIAQGYQTILLPAGGARALEDCATDPLPGAPAVTVVQDRLRLQPARRARFIESLTTALHFGGGECALHDEHGALLQAYAEGLRAPGGGRVFRRPTPHLFSFNSPLGACPRCRGFGRTIEIDPRLVIPDPAKSLAEGAIRAFSGAIYSASKKDLLRACRRHGIPADLPWQDLDAAQRAFVWDGEPGYREGAYQRQWYGVRRFFAWLEDNTYKMHVRVFLARYRTYVTCQDCGGARLQPEALCWRWRGHTLPQLYAMPVADLRRELHSHASPTGNRQFDLARDAIFSRLDYLAAVGLGYLSLDRSSRSLSGGETQRVNLTTCLGAALVDTLFILDEPSVGLHQSDIGRLIGILRHLTDLGNTVVVVEHDESLIRAADHVIEIGPQPGAGGGEVIYAGPVAGLVRHPTAITGAYLSGRATLAGGGRARPVRADGSQPWLRLRGVSKHNLCALDCAFPLRRLVVLGGVSGSGKSTLLHHGIHEGLRAARGESCEDPATIAAIESDEGFREIVRVDQAPVSRTPRSNAAVFSGAWDGIRRQFAATDAARAAGLDAGAFSFNSGHGRCPHCEGLGHERIEMQFMADVFVPCPVCAGRRFLPEVLAVRWRGLALHEVLQLTVDAARRHFADLPAIDRPLAALAEVGLGYLPLGQPLNTLSGGESQRLKLVRYCAEVDAAAGHALLLLDEPTTGLHRHDVGRLLAVLQRLVDRGHSLVVIEHQPDVIAAADWLIELGPGAGRDGGRIVRAGPPDADAIHLRQGYGGHAAVVPPATHIGGTRAVGSTADDTAVVPPAAPDHLEIVGARQHNLKDLSLRLPLGAFIVVTGVSGSGKSSLAFDIVFAEGQRRFLESMSSWARQYVEQLPRPEVDHISGIPPTVAIEQRVTRGTRKSTVATITEVAQYLRLLYARLGVPHSPVTGVPLQAQSVAAIRAQLARRLQAPASGRRGPPLLCAPLVRGRKGHHEPLAQWAGEHGYHSLRIDGALVPLDRFRRLDRYREHDIELVVGPAAAGAAVLNDALRRGRGQCLLVDGAGAAIAWFSTTRADPATGEAFPELDPKHFSWNSPRGWCPACQGSGAEAASEASGDDPAAADTPCPVCAGERLNPLARAVYLFLDDGTRLNLPAMLRLTPPQLLAVLPRLRLDATGAAVLAEILPEVRERLRFMQEVGLPYLSLDRATRTLSGGEAQRIRLAAQLGSNLSGVLYVLDEPSIGLHARDNARLLDALDRLKARGNTLLVVEHDVDTMRRADRIIDLGPGAGRHGGMLLAEGSLAAIRANPDSLTGRYLRAPPTHPLRGAWRPPPAPWTARSRHAAADWLMLDAPRLRNLKGGRLLIPKGRLTVVCGVSGAGKSTLVRDLLLPAVSRALAAGGGPLAGRRGDAFHRLTGAAGFDAVIEVDQDPIGKTPRSTPATYIGAFDMIRELFGRLPEARLRGHNTSTFSFNTKGGRCETCKGAGQVKLEMNFLPDTYLPCEDCGGSRFGGELAEIRFAGRNIAEVLALGFAEAAEMFAFHAPLRALLELMVETGLGYLTLGQSSPTLSGGEAQRVKLVSELARGLQIRASLRRGSPPRNLYLLEEPTIGLHLADCEKLIHLLQRMVDQGHTVMVIEHHPGLIREADHVVEIGPEGGDAGGRILYQGPLPGLLACKDSPTAGFLRD